MIPLASGMHAAKEALHEFSHNPKVKPSNDSLIQMLEFVLTTKNKFKFNGEYYLQVGGTSIGTQTAPSYANTYMGKFEDDHVYSYPTQLLFLEKVH